MRPLFSRVRNRVHARGDDRGATLIYALIFITVIAIVVAAVLSLADTNVRTTIALRDQAAETAAADGAAQIAINELRHGDYVGPAGNCFPSAPALELTNFYDQPDGSDLSARVECGFDDTLSVRPGATGAGFALLTLPQGSQEGLTLKANGCGSGGSGANCGGIDVHGDVYSTGRTHADAGQLLVTGDFTSGSCTIGTNARISDNGGPIVVGSPECTTPSPVGDPGYVLPPGAAPNVDATGTWTTSGNCNTGVRTFKPGLYASNQAMNALNANCALSYFEPGIYWFAFDGVWETQNAKVVAGALTAPPVSVNMADACPSPFTDYDPNAGVIFVFGGDARWKIGNGGQAAVCAAVSQVTGQPPFALFGLTSSVTGAAGTVSPPAGGSCIRKDKDSGGGGANAPCATFQTVNHSDVELYLDGATYLPNGWVDLDLRGSADQYIVGGLVVRQFSLFSPASATLPQPLSSGPLPGGSGEARTVVVLNVFVCPDGGSCATGGGLRLKVKIGIIDPSVVVMPGQRTITVYSWSVQR